MITTHNGPVYVSESGSHPALGWALSISPPRAPQPEKARRNVRIFAPDAPRAGLTIAAIVSAARSTRVYRWEV